MELDSIRKKDQLYRSNFDSIQSLQPAEFNRAMKKMEIIDLSNSNRVVEIINKTGWPGRSLVGEKGNNTVFLVIQHSDLRIQQDFLPLLKKSVLNGESSGKDLAYLEDRVLLRTGRKQIYGTQVKYDINTGKYFVDLLEDPDNVDKRRKEIGLNTIGEYLKKGWDLNWNLDTFKSEQKMRETHKN